MNVFILDADPAINASFHTDSHVVKMILESAQILCTCHWLVDGDIGEGWYKPTHVNHPVIQWCTEHENNYHFVFQLFAHLSMEYEFRFNKEHATWVALGDVLTDAPDCIPYDQYGQDDFVLCMPEKYWPADSKRVNLEQAVLAYRRYYRGEKQHLFKWSKRFVPYWIAS